MARSGLCNTYRSALHYLGLVDEGDAVRKKVYLFNLEARPETCCDLGDSPDPTFLSSFCHLLSVNFIKLISNSKESESQGADRIAVAPHANPDPNLLGDLCLLLTEIEFIKPLVIGLFIPLSFSFKFYSYSLRV